MQIKLEGQAPAWPPEAVHTILLLRSHSDIAKAYEELKLRLAHSAGSNRVGYILGKSDFVEDVLKKFP